ncbi:MAG: hypothetical protein MN733_28620, partial [Nitrososphaera sp.]|nr:hypothetical protein [Nitrososphaera sp.]
LLANSTPSKGSEDADAGLEERSLFDAAVDLEISGATLEPFRFWLAPKDYRSHPEMYGKGINCSAVWNAETRRLQSESLPVFRQPLYRTRDIFEVQFQQMDSSDPVTELSKVEKEMGTFLTNWDSFLASDARKTFTDEEAAACKGDRNNFADELSRFRLGLETLRRDSRLLQAFRLMNRVFGRLASKSAGKVRAWRLFQIGFIVSQLPSLAVRELNNTDDSEYAETLRSALEEVGILWFPTGGGKTEAYLGLIATALLYDRLRGRSRGVCAWMRFPLRMLSLQQLERLARVIAVLNELRAENTELQTGDPFAIGYFVGDNNTPNSISEEDFRKYEQNRALREDKRLLRKCPFCSSSVDVRPLRASWRLAHV